MSRVLVRSALAALGAVLLATACAPSGGKTLVAEFADVGDLVGRASVQQSDAVVGRVVGITLVQRKGQWLARVRMSLRPGTRTPEGMRAVVRSTSLLGEKFVDLELPSNPGAELGNDAVIPSSRTGKAPELEEVFRQLGAILASGALTDLGSVVNASAMIVEGQQADIGRVIDGTAKLVQSIANEKDALASALTDLNSAAKTLRGGSSTIDHALRSSADALALVASQRDKLDALVVQLDRLGKPLGDLTRAHRNDIDAQVKALHRVVPELYAARDKLSDAVHKLPPFTKLFARAAPGDYVQLDIAIELPSGLPLIGSSASDVLWGATR